VAEAAAGGRVAELYADIRRVLGLPFVNLVYRHLACDEGRLEAVWAALGPNLSSQAATAAADELVRSAAPAAAAPLPPDVVDETLAAATLDAYARGNSLNLLGMQALLHGCAGRGDKAPAPPTPGPGAILPMTALEQLPAATRALLDETAALLVGTRKPILVPSLLRHFAHDARLLAAVRDTLLANASERAARRAALEDRARRRAAGLPHPVEPLRDADLREVAARFVDATSALLVAGETIRAALARGAGCRRPPPGQRRRRTAT
jgi:hypothetical protein